MTGSTARLRKTGVVYDDERTEREPFGQQVLSVAPPEEEPSVEQMGSRPLAASEPEWLCALQSVPLL